MCKVKLQLKTLTEGNMDLNEIKGLHSLILKGNKEEVLSYMETYNLTPKYYFERLEEGKNNPPHMQRPYLPLPVGEAVRAGRLDVMNAIISKGFDPNAQDYKSYDIEQRRPIHWACRAGRLDIVKCLIEDHRVDPDAKDDSGKAPIFYATEEMEDDHNDVVKYLIECGVSLEGFNGIYSTTVLHECVFGSKPETVEYVLSTGIDVNTTYDGQRSPLCDLASYGVIPENALVLLNAGANVEDTDLFGCTPFLLAASNHEVELLRVLISKGADSKAVNNYGRNALHFAMDNELPYPIVEYLVVELGLECLNSRNSHGNTPFLTALERISDQRVFELLVNYGCSITNEFDKLEVFTEQDLFKRIPNGREFFQHLKRLAFKPRTLQDLASVKLRRMLGIRLESAVNDLPLPEILKDLIRPLSIDDV